MGLTNKKMINVENENNNNIIIEKSHNGFDNLEKENIKIIKLIRILNDNPELKNWLHSIKSTTINNDNRANVLSDCSYVDYSHPESSESNEFKRIKNLLGKEDICSSSFNLLLNKVRILLKKNNELN